MTKIIDGKSIATEIRDEIKNEISALNISPCLAVVLVGNNEASKLYVRNKKRVCEYVGIKSIVIELSEKTSEESLLNEINKLNNDSEVNGILVQLPLPDHFDSDKIINAISPLKDVDCFHPVNLGNLLASPPVGYEKDRNVKKGFLPCTPAGIVEIIKRSGYHIVGQNVVIVGRSNIVGKPAAVLMLKENATVTVAHSKTKNLPEITSRADILIAAIGKANFITPDMVKEGAVVIDVGMNRVEGKFCGDVDFESVSKKAEAITPVPGGVGLMTTAILMKNCLEAYRLQRGIN